MNLEPVAPMETAVSNTSFIDWSDNTILTDNGDGTYDVTVSATVNVVEKSGDALTLSAVLDNYFTTVDLVSGSQEVSLTIENVPAESAYDKVTIAINGTQTVSDVYLFVVDGERETAQGLIGYSDLQLPVHAEVDVEPERILNFYKTTKISVGKDTNGETIYTCIPLSGITFDIYFVASMSDYVNESVVLPDKKDIDLGQLGDSTYHYPDYTVTTDDFGRASVSLSKNGLPDGVYVVAERDNIAVKEHIAPFYIMVPNTNETLDDWDYEVTLEPKNDVIEGPEVNKDVISIDQKRASVDAGEEFTWIIRGEIPVDLADAKEYVITDELDYRLSYAGDLKVKVEKTADEANSVLDGDALIEGEDYFLTVSGGDVTFNDGQIEDIDKFEVKLTARGRDKVSNAVGSDYEDYEIRIYFNTVVDEDASMGEDIPNEAVLTYISSVGFRYEDDPDEDPVVYTCGINLYKYDAKNEGSPLAGARFKLARIATTEEIEAGISTPLVTTEGAKSVIYEEFYTALDDKGCLTGRKDTVETVADGRAMLYGLEDGTYYLVEIKAPNGYNLLNYPVKVILNSVSHVTVDDPETAENENMTVKVANSNAFVLPETGGIGTTIFKICGGVLIIAAVAILIVKKKKDKDEEE